MFIKHVNLFFKNYMFKFVNEYFVTLFIIIINFLFYAILIYNDFKQIIYLSQKLRIELIINLKANDDY